MSSVIVEKQLAATENCFYWQRKPHFFNPRGPSYQATKPYSLCADCNLPRSHSIHSVDVKSGAETAALPDSRLQTPNSELTVSDRMMTCPACSRVLQVSDDGTLPAHFRSERFLYEARPATCPGSYTKAQPHRMLPEAEEQRSEVRGQSLTPNSRLSFIEFVEEPADSINHAHVDRNLRAVAESVHFLHRWLSIEGMPVDDASLTRVMGHANNVGFSALRLLSPYSTSRVLTRRKASLASGL